MDSAREITALLSERVSDFDKADKAMKASRFFLDWDEAREDMRLAVGAMSGLIDRLVIQYNAMAKRCGVTSHKDIVEHIDLSVIDSSHREAM